MNPLIQVLSSAPRELNCVKVFCPELDSDQYIAEIDGVEMSEFIDLWTQYSEESEELTGDYQRAAIAFCWCSKNRDRFVKEFDDFKKSIELLRTLPGALTRRLFTVADAMNCFVGVDHSAKKSLLATLSKLKSDDGSGEQQ